MKKVMRMCSTIPCVLIASGTLAHGVIAPQSPEELQERAEVIVTGRVTAAEVTTKGSPLNSDWVVVLQMEVDAVEKGDRIRAGENISVRCWQLKRRTGGWTGASGHGDIPAKGSWVRMWLGSHGAGWSPLEPNGIELLDGTPALDFSKEMTWSRWIVIGLSVAVGVVVVLVLVLRRRKMSGEKG